MARPSSKHPTDLELEILKILWRDGASTVRQVRAALAPRRDLAHTSVMTIMTIMTEKKYLARRKEAGAFVYRPLIAQEKTVGRMLSDLVNRAFDGSAGAAAVHLLEAAQLDKDELQELRLLIERKSKEDP